MEPVENVNALTRRWLSEQGEASTVLSGAGVWPLLGFLLEAANQPGRAELQGTLDVESGGGAKAAGALLEIMKSIPAVRVALGLWTDPRLPLNQEWVGRLPLGTSQRLTGDPAADQKRLDAWASEHTEGLIPQFPATVDSGTLLLLASALLVQTTWIQPFDESRYQVPDGPWAGRTVDALQHTTSVLDRVRVATTPLGPVTALTVMGSDDIDVHLVLGEAERSAAEVSAAGVDVVGRSVPATAGDALPEGTPGPGVTVSLSSSLSPHDRLDVLTIPFEVGAEHDLLDHPDVFGIRTLSDRRHGRFAGISAEPLAISQARQNAMALFTATGFKAAAVTAFGMRYAGMVTAPTHRVKRVAVVFDRPFAFYAVHRRTGLILAAGWIAEP